MPRTRSTWPHAAVLAGMVAAASLLFLPALADPTHTLVGATTADNAQHAWFFRWLPYALATHRNPLFAHVIDAPGGVNLMWNTWVPLPALLLSPLTLLAGPVASFDVAITLGVALSAWCAYLSALRFVRRRVAATVAGAAYGFSPFLLDQAYTGHSNMVIAVVPPLLVLLLDSLLTRASVSMRRSGVALGLLLCAQLYITEELLATEVLMAAVVVVVAALVRPDLATTCGRRLGRTLGWALAVAVPLTAYPLWFQFFGPAAPSRVLSEPNFFVTDLLNVVLPTTSQGLEPPFAAAAASHYLGNSGEWGGYVGVPMLVAAVYVAWRCRSSARVRVVAVTSAVALVLSFGSTLHVRGVDTHVPLPGVLLEHLPLLDNLLPARFAVYVALGLALLLGVFVDALPRTRAGVRVAVAVPALVALTYLPPLPFPTRAPVVPEYFAGAAAAASPGTTVLVIPFAHDFYSTQAVLWQAASGMAFAMPEGYMLVRQPSGRAGEGPPPSLTATLLAAVDAGQPPALSSAERASVLDELRGWRVVRVVLGPGDAHPAAMRSLLTTLLGSAPRDQGGVAVWDSVPH